MISAPDHDYLVPINELANEMGFTMDAYMWTPWQFSRNEPHFSSPFSIIHGRDFLTSLMVREQLAKMTKRRMPDKNKYHI